MPKEQQPSFTVTDRRKFTYDGELRDPSAHAETETITPEPAPVIHTADPAAHTEAAAATEAREQAAETATPGPATATPTEEALETLPDPFPEEEQDEALGPVPTSQQTADQHAAYRQSSERLDDMIRQANPGIPAQPNVDFEHLVQSLYMAAAVAMGAAAEPGQQPQVDIIGARQSIDMLAVLGEKTKGNLNPREEKLLQSALFNLRMMFLEITNSIAAAAAKPPSGKPKR